MGGKRRKKPKFSEHIDIALAITKKETGNDYERQVEVEMEAIKSEYFTRGYKAGKEKASDMMVRAAQAVANS